MPRLENWSTCTRPDADPYTAPEVQLSVQGKVYDHPDRPDGEGIITSPIRSFEGRTVTTYSGTVYELGQISEDFVRYCRDELYGPDWNPDPENPLTPVAG